jgi:hypothetical protein
MEPQRRLSATCLPLTAPWSHSAGHDLVYVLLAFIVLRVAGALSLFRVMRLHASAVLPGV